ncbi:hypothetical protein AMC87_CH04040 [Rhizobium phaseoli]|nr:hypothetical protein AMC87_CH04040 [Rhizobium phaseoli]
MRLPASISSSAATITAWVVLISSSCQKGVQVVTIEHDVVSVSANVQLDLHRIGGVGLREQ